MIIPNKHKRIDAIGFAATSIPIQPQPTADTQDRIEMQRQWDMVNKQVTSDKLLSAAKLTDWLQVVLNGGPPCFHLEHGTFCLRAQRWEGHLLKDDPDHGHPYIPLHEMMEIYASKKGSDTK